MIDDEYIDRKFTEIVDQQYIIDSRFPRLTKMAVMIGEAVITTINTKNINSGRDIATYTDNEKVDTRTKLQIGNGIMTTAGLIAISPIVINAFSTIYGQIIDGFRQI